MPCLRKLTFVMIILALAFVHLVKAPQNHLLSSINLKHKTNNDEIMISYKTNQNGKKW